MTSLKGTHKVILGKSFTVPDKVEYHSYRYDFKPASLDPNQSGVVEVGAPPQTSASEQGEEQADGGPSDSVSVYLPNVSGTSTSHTCFKGNRRAVQKECFLIVNKKTGQVTIERVKTAVQLKKTREEIRHSSLLSDKLGSRRPAAQRRPHHLTVQEMSSCSSSEDEEMAPPKSRSPPKHETTDDVTEVMDDQDSLDGDSDIESAAEAINNSVLLDDLRLSESGSDSD